MYSLDITILRSILKHLPYQRINEPMWQKKFLNHYFCNWFSSKDCSFTKNEKKNIISYIHERGYHHKNMVETTNLYVWLYAEECLQYDMVIKNKIKNILLIQKTNHTILLVLYRCFPFGLSSLILSFIPWM